MTSIEFETATITDVLKKANQVAPAKAGSAFDKAAGIVLDVTPNDPVKCIVRATNLDVFYIEAVDCLSSSGESVRWRLPAPLLTHVIGTLPATSGKTVRVEDDPATGSRVTVSSGRMKSAMSQMDASYYPLFDPATHVTFTDVQSIGGRIAQAAWAVGGPADVPLNGLHFTGTHILATDRYRVVRVPCLAALPYPVTVPASVLGAILKQTTDVQIGLDSTMMYFKPDDYTQISSVLYEGSYPPVEKIVKTEFESQVTIRKEDLISRINRSLAFAGADRAPILRMFLGRGEIATILGNEELGLIRDIIEVPGQLDHRRIEIGFTPKYMTDALTNAPNDTITLKFDATEYSRTVYIDGGSGYEAWIMTRSLAANNA